MPKMKITNDKLCNTCGTQLDRKRYNGRLEDWSVYLRRKYCSQECMGTGFRGTWRTDVLPAQGRYRARTLGLKTSCKNCGKTRNIDRHHIDENPLNNSLENLVDLCRSCHSIEHHPPKVCSIPLCGNPHKGRTLCNKHLIRWRKWGDPLYIKKG